LQNSVKKARNRIFLGIFLNNRFAGALSSDRVDELQKKLNQMRNEWDRNI